MDLGRWKDLGWDTCASTKSDLKTEYPPQYTPNTAAIKIVFEDKLEHTIPFCQPRGTQSFTSPLCEVCGCGHALVILGNFPGAWKHQDLSSLGDVQKNEHLQLCKLHENIQ